MQTTHTTAIRIIKTGTRDELVIGLASLTDEERSLLVQIVSQFRGWTTNEPAQRRRPYYKGKHQAAAHREAEADHPGGKKRRRKRKTHHGQPGRSGYWRGGKEEAHVHA